MRRTYKKIAHKFKFKEHYTIIEGKLKDNAAEVDFDKRVITINKEEQFDKEEYRKSLFHEILHIILQEIDPEFKLKNGTIKIDEESLVQFLEKTVFEAKDLNRKLFRELFK